MFLFLDVVSPIPEFHLINDKKIIESIKIINESHSKLSDQIIPKYLKINKTFNLSKNISNLIITTGPGSYTALRVGASFIAGISYSMNLPVAKVSNENIYEYLHNSNSEVGIYFESSNRQKFFSYKTEMSFLHKKLDNDNFIPPEHIKYIYYNNSLPKFIKEKKFEKFSIKKTIVNNLDHLKFKKELKIRPIYISTNKILN